MPPTLGKLWGARDLLGSALRLGTARHRNGPVREVVTADVALDRLPALTCWPQDGGPFVTLPLVYTEHPEGKGHNLGMYRLQVNDATTTGMHWQIGKGGGFHHAVAESRREALPATVFLGGPPALVLAAIAPLRLTGTRPGILAMFIEDTDRTEWRDLRERLDLEGETRQFLAHPSARGVVAVTCVSRLELLGAAAPDAAPDGEMRFRNPAHPAAKTPALAPAVLSSV